MCRECLQLNSNLDMDRMDVTISNDISTCEWEKVRTGLGYIHLSIQIMVVVIHFLVPQSIK